MYGGMQSFNPSAEDFRTSGNIGDIFYGEAGFAETFGSAAAGYKGEAEINKAFAKRYQACLV